MTEKRNLVEIAKAVRRSIVHMHARANASHIGASFSCVDILVSLLFDVVRMDTARDALRLYDAVILSKGHAASALYATLAHRGFFDMAQLDGYCVAGGVLPGHVTKDCVPGVVASAGSLGHGLSLGLGMALADRHNRSDRRTYVVLGDGECDEGSIWEAALFAAQHALDSVVVIVDCNNMQAFGSVPEVLKLDPFKDKWEAFGWSVAEVDGHDCNALRTVLHRMPITQGKPSVVLARTTKGKGVSFMENMLSWHYKSPNEDEVARALQELA